MALLFCDGFENRSTVSAKWSTVTYTGSITTADKRTGSQSACSAFGAHKFVPAGDSTVIFGVAVKAGAGCSFAIGPTQTGTDVGAAHFSLSLLGNGQLAVDIRGSYPYSMGELGRTAGGVWRWDQWNYIEVKAVIHNSTGSVLVKLNGELVLNLTGKDTTQYTSTVWDGFYMSAGGSPIYMDDLVVCDGTGSQNNDWMGECRVVNILPVTDAVAAGSNADFTCLTSTDHGAMVDEANPDDDTSYVYSSTLNHVDSWEFGALGYTGTIKGVQLDLVAKKTESGTRALAHVTRPTGTNRVSTTDHYLGMTNYLHYLKVWELNPDDSAAWEVADIDGAEFGVKVSV